MFHSSPVAYLFDVDNTLLDNDRVAEDLRQEDCVHAAVICIVEAADRMSQGVNDPEQ